MNVKQYTSANLSRIIPWFLLIIVAGFIVWDTFIKTSTSDFDAKILQHEANIQLIKKRLEDNKKQIEHYNATILQLTDSVRMLNNKIQVNKNKLNSLKKEYDERIKVVSGFTISDIELYFANRYNQR